jgi:hypothetical protein
MLDGGAEVDPDTRYDVADEWRDERGAPRRCRVWDDQDPPAGMRLVRTIDTRPEADEEEGDTPPRRRWQWFGVSIIAYGSSSGARRTPSDPQIRVRSTPVPSLGSTALSLSD